MSAADASAGDELTRFGEGASLLMKVLDASPVGTALVDPASHVAYANPALRLMLGYGEQSLNGLPAGDLAFGEFLSPSDAQAQRLLTGRSEAYRSEQRLRRRDGKAIWCQASCTLLRNEKTGAPMFIVAQVSDIDAQKRAEEAAASVDDRWNLALEGAGQGVWDHNIRTGTMFYSRMWRIMRGVGPDEDVNGAMEEWLKRVHPDDRDRIRRIVIQQDAGEIPYNAFEYRERHRAGHYIWILSRGRPVEWFPDGLPSRIVGTDTDITNLKRAEEELAEEKERLNVTLRAISDGVISTDAVGVVTFINPAAERLTGWKADEAIGRAVTDVFQLEREHDLAAAPPNPVVRCLALQGVFECDDDVNLVARDGTRLHVRAAASPVRTEAERTVGVVLVFQDVTERRVQQRKLAHSASHDDLTGLPNRAAFERALTTTVGNAASEHRRHALCFIDLDRFKRVNDSAGHAAGDELLRSVGKAIRQNRRVQDFVARIGGDEFALLLSDCSAEDAEEIAEGVIRAIANIGFAWHGRPFEIGASVGITIIGAGADSPADVMERADRACYAAKAAGRNRISVDVPRTEMKAAG